MALFDSLRADGYWLGTESTFIDPSDGSFAWTFGLGGGIQRVEPNNDDDFVAWVVRDGKVLAAGTVVLIGLGVLGLLAPRLIQQLRSYLPRRLHGDRVVDAVAVHNTAKRDRFPDGETIVFWAYRSGNRDIWTMPAAGGPALQITTHPTYDVYPAWTHDSTQIAFDSWRSGNRDIWIVDAKGGEPRQLTTHPASDVTGAWSPDGQWLVFGAPGPRLWLMSADGSERKLLSAGPAYSTARWSPDSETVFAKRNGNFWAFNVEDGSEHRVTDLVGRSGGLGSGMTTDGSWIYFAWRQDLGDIWVMDVVHGE